MRNIKSKAVDELPDLVKVHPALKYTNSKGNPIENINDWERLVFKSTKKEIHWKVGRSAYSIADFMMNRNGEPFIKKIVSELLKENVFFERAIAELEIRFDNYGHGREHDLGIWGTTDSKKKVFLGIESKVDEPFGQTVSEAYISASINRVNGKETKAPERVEKLLKQNFGTKIERKHFDIRYQLLFSTMGVLEAKADISIFFVVVFKTKSYDNVKGKENYRDYCQFIQNVVSEKIPCSIDNVEIHKLTIDNRQLYSIYTEIIE